MSLYVLLLEWLLLHGLWRHREKQDLFGVQNLVHFPSEPRVAYLVHVTDQGCLSQRYRDNYKQNLWVLAPMKKKPEKGVFQHFMSRA